MSSRWAKGQSGNPKGRPRKTRPEPLDARKLLMEALQKPITIKQGEVSTQTTMLGAAIQQVTAQAAQGNSRARRDLLDFMNRFGVDPTGQTSSDELTAAGRKILHELFFSRSPGSASSERIMAPLALRDDDSEENG